MLRKLFDRFALIAATEQASNRMIDIEDLDDDELKHLRERFDNLVETSPRLDDDTRQQTSRASS